jgi:glycerate-2-kinase
VRRQGIGGRNAETVLRAVTELSLDDESPRVIFSVGTDGIDGNSPAAGAIADQSTLTRAKSAGLNPESFLQNSDAYSFFKTLGDDITLGPTGTNVRDVRIYLGRR